MGHISIGGVSQKPCLPSSEWHNEFLVLSKMLCHHGFFFPVGSKLFTGMFIEIQFQTLWTKTCMKESALLSPTTSFSFLIFGRVKKEYHIILLLHILYMFHFILFSFYILLLSRKEIKTNIKKDDFLKESPPSKPPQGNLCGFS